MPYFSKWLHWRVNFERTPALFSPLLIASRLFRKKRVDSFQYLSRFIFTGCLLKSPAFLFKISANEIFFYLMKCRAYAIHLALYWLYYRIIFFCNGRSCERKRRPFPPGLVEIKLRTEKDLNLTLAAIIICPFGFLYVSPECVCRSNLRVKS